MILDWPIVKQQHLAYHQPPARGSYDGMQFHALLIFSSFCYILQRRRNMTF